MRREGSGWTEYELRTLPMRGMTIGREELLFDRIVARFLADHFPVYRREDITDIVVNLAPGVGGLYRCVARVSYYHKKGEQV